MYARSAAAFLLALPILASAVALPRTISNSCNTGSVQCCNSTQKPTDEGLTEKLFGLLGLDIDVSDLTALVGLTCDPIDILGIGSNGCSAQTVCCENNSFKGLVALGCTPINIQL